MYERVYLPLCEVADTPFGIRGYDLSFHLLLHWICGKKQPSKISLRHSILGGTRGHSSRLFSKMAHTPMPRRSLTLPDIRHILSPTCSEKTCENIGTDIENML